MYRIIEGGKTTTGVKMTTGGMTVPILYKQTFQPNPPCGKHVSVIMCPGSSPSGFVVSLFTTYLKDKLGSQIRLGQGFQT